jgi:tRNA C32,U32 (ribose-2'-O)-methylase TrmJ
VHIPVNPDCSSLNLAAAVMVLCYELRKAALQLEQQLEQKQEASSSTVNSTIKEEWDQMPATAEDLDRFLLHMESVLVKLNFLDPTNPRQLMRRLRRLYQRIQPDRMEINILRGILAATEDVLDKS